MKKIYAIIAATLLVAFSAWAGPTITRGGAGGSGSGDADDCTHADCDCCCCCCCR